MPQKTIRVFGSGLRKVSRRRLLLLTAFVVAALVLSNYLVQRQYVRLDKQISSIYQDRLMPSHYLFELQTLLLNKKLIQEHGELKGDGRLQEINAFDLKIDSILINYEKTYLTGEESKEWDQFRNALAGYEELEAAIIQLEGNEAEPLAQRIEQQFRDALSSLARLNTLQTTEGNRIKASSQALLSGALLQSYMQISLVIILLAAGIALLFSISPKEEGKEKYN